MTFWICVRVRLPCKPDLLTKLCPDLCSSNHGVTCSLGPCACIRIGFHANKRALLKILEPLNSIRNLQKHVKSLRTIQCQVGFGTQGNGFPMWIGGTSNSDSTNGRFALLLGLDVPWHVAGNWQCTPESWEILSIKSWGKWCAYHTQCQNDWLNHKKKRVGACFQTAVLYNGSTWAKHWGEDKGLWSKKCQTERN